MPSPDPGLDREAAELQGARARAQINEIGGGALAWKIHLRVGAVAPTIARHASERGVARIVLGRGRHAPADRWPGSETTLRVVQLAHVPVLAVPSGVTGIPRRALVGVDFSEFSVAAARECMHLLGKEGEIRLVHATPFARDAEEAGPEWMRTCIAGARARLEDLARDLASPGKVRVEVSLAGVWLGEGTAEVLLEAARVGEADLIAAGSHGLGFFGRLLMGSVSTWLLRRATCSVLLVPPRKPAPEVERMRPPETMGVPAGAG